MALATYTVSFLKNKHLYLNFIKYQNIFGLLYLSIEPQSKFIVLIKLFIKCITNFWMCFPKYRDGRGWNFGNLTNLVKHNEIKS